jgi:hypothetical protein
MRGRECGMKGKKQIGRHRRRWKHVLDLKHRTGGLELDLSGSWQRPVRDSGEQGDET